MLRAVFALAVLAAGAAVGFHLTSKLSERVRILEEYIMLFETAAGRMRYTRDELCAVFGDNFAGYEFERGRPFSEQWHEMTEPYKGVLKKKDYQVVISFANGIGAGDLESQLDHFSLYQTLLSESLEDAKREREAKAGLYRVLPFSIGMTIAILLL